MILYVGVITLEARGYGDEREDTKTWAVWKAPLPRPRGDHHRANPGNDGESGEEKLHSSQGRSN